MIRKHLKIVVMAFIFVAVWLPFSNVYGITSVDSINYYDQMSGSAFDIRGTINGNSEISTTFGNGGYHVHFRVSDVEEEIDETYNSSGSTDENGAINVNTQEKSIINLVNGGTVENNGVTIKITGTKLEDNESIKVEFLLINNSDVSKNYAVSADSDIYFASNDRAAVAKDDLESMQITQDNQGNNSTYKAQMKISFSPVASTAWIGYYGDRVSNRHTDSSAIFYTYQDNLDTGMAFSWEGTLEPGESKPLVSTFKFQIAEDGVINFFNDGNETETPDFTREALVGGGVTMPSTKSCDEDGFIYVWCTKKDGTGECFESNSGTIMKSEVLNLYEVKVKEYTTLHFETNGGSAIDDITQKVGSKLSIPTPTKQGYSFMGWYLDNDTFNNKPSYLSMPGIDVTLYAKWENNNPQVDPGTVEVVEPETPNYSNAEIGNDVSELKDIVLTDEDKKIVDSGNDIYLYLQVQDISETISNEEKELINNAIDENSEIGMYLDISLFKKIGDNDPEKIHKTNGKVKVSFEIPDELINEDPNIDRNYYILRIHDGTVNKLDVTINGKIGVFETDEFSTYVLAYTDTKIAEETTDDSNSPKTGDLGITLWVALMIISLIGFFGINKVSRRK